MYLNVSELIKREEQKKVARVINEIHEKDQIVLGPGEKIIITIVKEQFASYLRLLHWAATFNYDTIYKVYRNNDLIYIGTEPVQEDMDHEKLYDYMYGFWISFEIINTSATNTYYYFLDYHIQEIE